MQIKVSSILVLSFLFGVSVALLISGRPTPQPRIQAMSEASVNSPSETTSVPSTAAYIVYTEKPAGEVEPESFHLSTLSSVIGSEAAAKDALLYVYKSAATGFSAKLTPEQVSQLEKKPGVLQVVPSQMYQVHSGSGGFGAMKMA